MSLPYQRWVKNTASLVLFLVSSRLTVEKKETEISSLLALAAAVLALLSAGLSVLWFSRIL